MALLKCWIETFPGVMGFGYGLLCGGGRWAGICCGWAALFILEDNGGWVGDVQTQRAYEGGDEGGTAECRVSVRVVAAQFTWHQTQLRQPALLNHRPSPSQPPTPPHS